MNNFDIKYFIGKKNKRLIRGLPFLEMKEAILGKRYDLSLVFIGATRSKTLTKKYRKKDKVSNILSFPLDDKCGEIFITPSLAILEAKKFSKTPKKYLGFLFIHGLLHLEGYAHGSKMEAREKALSKRFSLD